jgi:hypothetical protein
MTGKRDEKMNATQANDAMYMPAGSRPQRGFLQNRLASFGLTLIVMGASFGLYYLGLFGTVDGPLAPARMGTALAEMGVSQRHVIVMLLTLLIGALTWNWIFNLASMLAGQRMTCNAVDKATGETCGAAVQRLKHQAKRSGQTVVEYRCPHGHLRPEAHFHPVRKGTVSNTIWIGCAIFTMIAIFCV